MGLIAARLMREAVLAEADEQALEAEVVAGASLEALLRPLTADSLLPVRPCAYDGLDRWLRDLRLETLV